jgi:DNA mismatch endonuclease (patch repair protein)
MDIFSREKRSKVMAMIRSRDTGPEMILRRGLHRHGFRFRLHDSSLPGRPDLVLRKLRTVIQVRGCFWHGHRACIDGHLPKTRPTYWKPKIEGNILRDRRNDAALRRSGWHVIGVWECRLVKAKHRESELKKIVQLLQERGLQNH